MAADNPDNRSVERAAQSADGPRPAPGVELTLPHEEEHFDHDQPGTHRRRWIILGVAVVLLVVLGQTFVRRWVVEYFTTVSTDDAYVNSHVTYISPRVAGYVSTVYVDDNDRVQEGDLLLELDHEPYQVAVRAKQAALETAEANLTAAMAQVRAQEAAARAGWFSLVNAQEQVRYQIATIRSNVANLRLQEANLRLAEKEVARVRALVAKEAAAQEELDQRTADYQVAQQRVLLAV